MAKIYGELEYAILQQVQGTTQPYSVPGNIWMNIATPTAAVPYVFDGSNPRPLLMGPAGGASIISQNSGTACTVNWANGTVQQVVLTNNCVISFSNPQAGQQHVLMITQGSSSGISTYYRATFNMPDQDARRGFYQPIGMPPVGESMVFAWFYSSAIKAAYATIPNITFSPNSAAPGTACTISDISPDGKTIAVGCLTSPYIYFYDLFDSGQKPGLGVKNKITPAVPSVGATGSVNMAYSPNGDFIFITSATSPYLFAYNLELNIAVGSAVSVMATPPAGIVNTIAVHPTGTHVAVGHATTPFMSIYPYSSAGWGAKISNPSQLPDAQVLAMAWSPAGDFLAAVSQTSPYLRVWAFTNGASGTIGAVVSNPSTVPAAGSPSGVGKNVAWRPQGDYIAMGMNASPYLYVVPFSRANASFGTPLTIAAQPGAIGAVQWTPDGQYLVTCSATSPYVQFFSFASFTIGTAITYDGSNPGAGISDIVFSPGGDNAVLIPNTSGNLQGIVCPNVQRDYMRLNF